MADGQFLRNQDKFQTDPDWIDHILFYEYFNADTGAGVGGQPSDRLDWIGLGAVQQGVEIQSLVFQGNPQDRISDLLTRLEI
ncbi:MAG: hypothetical protein M0C28_30650 [Candidatus Moduliflexus flocculans]|nr:hypothetical protein [Candidatus Moduliflexus flocculans]